ncbi:TRAP-type C4-dicarboxylate transport system permease small subunit [Yoonia maricola]|uniref:TRAP transporter small permease protein n=1 Tax=Yoonia maricola TaxID=420999 RepID=A0A2M8W527_9RHOB|nr:TRAP transporter small permease [Yoonia maricola]PJI86006.1 TRAP-type C4-dicarboxylate transport system permease small subunit [Yoonia maricola]
MNRMLQKIYYICGMIAGGLILCICLLISAQIGLNAFGKFAPGLLPSTIPSYADFSGFMLAGATFLAMAHTLRAGGHIRVNLVVSRLPQKLQYFAEAVALMIATALVGYAAYFMGALVVESIHYNDVSSGIIPVALWIPQSVAAFGVGLFFVAVLHTLVDLIRAGKPILSSPGEV